MFWQFSFEKSVKYLTEIVLINVKKIKFKQKL